MRLKKRNGFTLMELLVALALFSVTTGLVTNLFLLSSRRQARTTTAVRVQGDARLVLETITRELREGTIAYEDIGTNKLATTDPHGAVGNAVFFQRGVDLDCPARTTHCVRIGRRVKAGDPEEWAPLTSAGVDAEVFDVLIAPVDDPFLWDETANPKQYKANEQPRATIHLVLTAPTGKAGDIVRIEAQTTIASRVYQR